MSWPSLQASCAKGAGRDENQHEHSGTEDFCEGCVLGKAYGKLFTPWSDWSKVIGELIHADVNGPLPVKSLWSAKYYVFQGRLQQVSQVFLHQGKEWGFQVFIHVPEWRVDSAGHRVKKFRCDGGNEFACEKVCVLSDRGIELLLSALNMPVKNRAAQGKKHTVVELARSVLSEQATKTDVRTGLWNCSICAQSHRKNTSYQKISNGDVEWSRDEELGSSICIWHGVLCIHPKLVS